MRNFRNALKHSSAEKATRPPSIPGANFQQMVIGWEISSKISNYVMMRNLAPGDLVKKAWDLCNQDWPGCSIMYVMHLKVIVFAGGLIVLQCLVRVQRHSQPLPTKLVFGCFDRGSYIRTHAHWHPGLHVTWAEPDRQQKVAPFITQTHKTFVRRYVFVWCTRKQRTNWKCIWKLLGLVSGHVHSWLKKGLPGKDVPGHVARWEGLALCLRTSPTETYQEK